MKCRVFPFTIKLSTSRDYMLGSVEILDYKKDFDDWDCKDLFPFTLALGGRGSFYHPLYLSLSDPLIAGIQMTFQEVFNCDFSLDDFELNLDKEEENQGKFYKRILLYTISKNIKSCVYFFWGGGGIVH